MYRGMNKPITPDVIEALAIDARVSMSDVLDKSGVSRGTYYRWRRGDGGMRPLTKARLVDAVTQLRAERLA